MSAQAGRLFISALRNHRATIINILLVADAALVAKPHKPFSRQSYEEPWPRRFIFLLSSPTQPSSRIRETSRSSMPAPAHNARPCLHYSGAAQRPPPTFVLVKHLHNKTAYSQETRANASISLSQKPRALIYKAVYDPPVPFGYCLSDLHLRKSRTVEIKASAKIALPVTLRSTNFKSELEALAVEVKALAAEAEMAQKGETLREHLALALIAPPVDKTNDVQEFELKVLALLHSSFSLVSVCGNGSSAATDHRTPPRGKAASHLYSIRVKRTS